MWRQLRPALESRSFPWSQSPYWEVIRCLLSPHYDTPSPLFYSIQIPCSSPLSLSLSLRRDIAAGCDRVIPHLNPVCLGLSARSLLSSLCQWQSCLVPEDIRRKACQIHRPSRCSVPSGLCKVKTKKIKNSEALEKER